MRKSSALKTAVAVGLSALLAVSAQAGTEIKLNGSGASFPFPIYSKWFKDFSATTIVLIYNLKGVKDLKLSREAYTGR